MGLLLNILFAFCISLIASPMLEVEEPTIDEVSVVAEREPGAELVGDVVIRDLTEEDLSEPPKTPSEDTSGQGTPTSPSTPSQPTQKPVDQSWKRGVPDYLLQAPNEDHIATIHDFEIIYSGWCPKDVPKDVWPDRLSPLATLGYESSIDKYEMATLEGISKWVWHIFRGGRSDSSSYRFTSVERVGIVFQPTSGGWYTNGRYIASSSGYYFTMDWDRKLIYADESLANIPITDDERATLQQAASWMTNRVRQLDAQYLAKCGS